RRLITNEAFWEGGSALAHHRFDLRVDRVRQEATRAQKKLATMVLRKGLVFEEGLDLLLDAAGFAWRRPLGVVDQSLCDVVQRPLAIDRSQTQHFGRPKNKVAVATPLRAQVLSSGQ